MATGLIGALRITLGIDASDFEKGTSKAKAEMRGFQRDFARMGKQWQNLGRDMMQWVTLPVLAAGAGVIKMAGDFETSMNQVRIATGATAAEFAAMRDLAQDIGAKTTKSATESAAAMEMLAKAGMRTTDIINGGARAAVALSEASGGSLEQSAAAITDTFTQFDKSTKDLPTIINRITGAVNESKFSFDDFALGMGQAGGVAGAAGVSFEEFTTTLAATSSMFHSGSDAGTSLKTFLNFLIPKSKEAAAAMKQFGLDFFDANGQMKDMADIAEMLQQQLGHLSEEDRNATIHAIFGTDAMRTAIGLMKMGREGFEEMNARITATDASAQAAERMKGFNAEMERLKGALENLAIAIADSGMLEAMTNLINSIAGWIDWLAKLNPELLKWITILAGVAAAIGPLLFVFGSFIKAVGMALPLLAKLGPLIQVLGAAFAYLAPVIVGVAKVLIAGLLAHPVLLGAAALIAGIYLAWKHWDKIGPIVMNMVNAVKTWLVDKFGGFIRFHINLIQSVGDKFKWLYDVVVGHSYVPDMVAGIGAEMAKLQKNMVEPAQKGADAVKQAFQQLQQDVLSLMQRLFPEDARYLQFIQELELIDKAAKKLGWTLEQTEAAVRALRDEYAKDVFGENEKPDWLTSDEDLVKEDNADIIRDIEKQTDISLEKIRKANTNTTTQMIQEWANMARNVIGSLRGMVQSIKSGDIWGAIEQFLDLVIDVIQMLSRAGAFGQGAGGSGSSSPPPEGFAGGGSFTVGGSGGVDSQLVRFRATPGEKVRITKGERENQGGLVVWVRKGEMFDAHVERVARPMAEDAMVRGATGGAAMAAHQNRRARRGALVR